MTAMTWRLWAETDGRVYLQEPTCEMGAADVAALAHDLLALLPPERRAAGVAAAEHAVCEALLTLRRAEADDAALWARVKEESPDGGPSPSPFVYTAPAEAQDAVRASRDRVRAAKAALEDAEAVREARPMADETLVSLLRDVIEEDEGQDDDMALARRLARVAEARAGAREAALRAAIEAALAEVHLTPDGAVDWRQTECTDASRAVDALAAAWHALAEPAPAVESICLRRAGRAVAP